MTFYNYIFKATKIFFGVHMETSQWSLLVHREKTLNNNTSNNIIGNCAIFVKLLFGCVTHARHEITSYTKWQAGYNEISFTMTIYAIMAISIFAPIYCQIKRATETGPTFPVQWYQQECGSSSRFSLTWLFSNTAGLGKHEENHGSTSFFFFFFFFLGKIASAQLRTALQQCPNITK